MVDPTRASLRELQSDFFDALFERSQRATAHIAASDLAAERRLDIYRNNLFESLTEALAAVYPTIDKLVGRPFFRYAAHAYIGAHPSRSGNLHDFGAHLPEFLARFEAARSLPYLPDCARLDWAWHAVFHTQPAPALDAAPTLAGIAALPEAARPGLRFRMQPALRLVASPYPIMSIWQANHPEARDAAPVDLDAGGEQVLVAQHGGAVSLERLSGAEHALLHALSEGSTLGGAIGAALERDAAFDAAASLAHHLAAGTLVEVLHEEP